jgi:pSer/pThr/pTyr-binding forkhead associated (FHA) protein
MPGSRQSAATLTVSRGPGAGRTFDIGAAAVTIGRHAQCDVRLEDTWVSRRHARIAWSGTQYLVKIWTAPTAPMSTASASVDHTPWNRVISHSSESRLRLPSR